MAKAPLMMTARRGPRALGAPCLGRAARAGGDRRWVPGVLAGGRVRAGSAPPRRVPAARDEAVDALLELCAETNRGADAGPTRRGQVEEAAVEVERKAEPVAAEDLPDALEGVWRLQYTTASDVTSILELATNGVARVGGIFQRFSREADGTLVVENVTEFGPLPGPPTTIETPLGPLDVPPPEPALLLADVDDAVTFTVRATYTVSSDKRIKLRFESARFSDVAISPLAEALIAPALLPRGALQMRLLQALQAASVTVALPNGAVSGGASYILTPVTTNTGPRLLVGRAVGSAGRFVFVREEP